MKNKQITFSLIIFLNLFCQLSLKAQREIIWTRANYLHNLGYNGAGIYINIFDRGNALTSHVEFGSRVHNARGLFSGSRPDRHTTAVTSIAVAGGKMVKGLAFGAEARIYSSEVNVDMQILQNILDNNIPGSAKLISNHSYGSALQNPTQAQQARHFGSYTTESKGIDHLSFKNPYWLSVSGAGNDNDKINISPVAPGYDKLEGGITTSKNTLTVGNLELVNFNLDGSPTGAIINALSSVGPTDDLRIKPDLCAPGTNIFVAGPEGTRPQDFLTDSYRFFSGTSAAAPVVSGIAALLQQFYYRDYGTYLKAATLKGLLMHTADKLNNPFSQEGPDPFSGYGLVNVHSAVRALEERGQNSIIEEKTLTNGGNFVLPLTTKSGHQIIASISWTDDQPSNSNAIDGPTNNSIPALLNDLDLLVVETSPEGALYFFYPYRLVKNPDNTLGIAHDNKNHSDNYEQVRFIPKKNFKYGLYVFNSATLTTNKQDYSLIITGLGNEDEEEDEEGSCRVNITIEEEIKESTIAKATNLIRLLGTRFKDAITTAFHAPNVLLQDVDILNGDFVAQTDGCINQIAVTHNARNIETLPIETVPDKQASYDGIAVYPNPVTNSFVVENNGASPVRSIQLFGTDGRLLHNGTYKEMNQITVNIQSLAAGIYYLIIKKEDGTVINRKLVKRY